MTTVTSINPRLTPEQETARKQLFDAAMAFVLPIAASRLGRASLERISKHPQGHLGVTIDFRRCVVEITAYHPELFDEVSTVVSIVGVPDGPRSSG